MAAVAKRVAAAKIEDFMMFVIDGADGCEDLLYFGRCY